MLGDIYATVKELTQPRSSGQAVNKHAVAAGRKLEPDFERMRKLSQPNDANGVPA